MAVLMGRDLSGDSMLPARGTERPASAKSRENTSSFALVLKEKKEGGEEGVGTRMERKRWRREGERDGGSEERKVIEKAQVLCHGGKTHNNGILVAQEKGKKGKNVQSRLKIYLKVASSC